MRGLISECAVAMRGLVLRVIGYAGLLGVAGLALLFAVAGLAGPAEEAAPAPPEPPGWTELPRPAPLFSLTGSHEGPFAEREAAYRAARHGDGSRLDQMIWTEGAFPTAALEVLRPGPEAPAFGAPAEELARRIGFFADPASLQPFGRIATKFGPLSVYAFRARGAAAPACVGFAHSHDDPAVQIAGWSCAIGARKAERQGLACALDRMTLLRSGGDVQIAAMFARAELQREPCEAQKAPPDWIAAGDSLRGAAAEGLRGATAWR